MRCARGSREHVPQRRPQEDATRDAPPRPRPGAAPTRRPQFQRWTVPTAMPAACSRAGRQHETHAIEDPVLTRRQLGSMGMAVEDAEDADQRRRPKAAVAFEKYQAPSRMAETRCRFRSRAAEAYYAKDAAERHHHRERDRQDPDRRGAQLRAHKPTATSAETWSSPETGWPNPVRNPPASSPFCMGLGRGRSRRKEDTASGRDRWSEVCVHARPEEHRDRCTIQNAPAEPTM